MADPNTGTRDNNADAVQHLDGGHLGCARLLILLRNFAVGLDVGAVVHLTTSDPVAPIDLPAWCRMTGHTYLGPVTTPGRPTYAIQVTDQPVPTVEHRPWHAATDRNVNRS
jgi:tRNA 2-thiouridine synthesizing protein A